MILGALSGGMLILVGGLALFAAIFIIKFIVLGVIALYQSIKGL